MATAAGPDGLHLYRAAPGELAAETLYEISRLRVAVFVVEQQCAYPELDGRDLEPGAYWVWASAGDRIIGTLRVLADAPDTARIGRVAIAAEARSTGIGARLMRYTLAELDRQPQLRWVVLDAQSYLLGWYQRLGFSQDGPEFVEDGIAHLPMRRPVQTSTAGGSDTAG